MGFTSSTNVPEFVSRTYLEYFKDIIKFNKCSTNVLETKFWHMSGSAYVLEMIYNRNLRQGG